MFRMVVFDMAGTTVDENNVVYKTVQEAVNAAGYDFNLEEVLAVAAGKEKHQAIKAVLATRNIYNEDLSLKIFADFKRRLDQAYAHSEIYPQPHARETFESLRQAHIKVVLNTGYSKPVAESLLTRLNWQIPRDIDLLVTADDVPRNRPHPDMIVYAMEKLGITNAREVVKVGDSAIDVEEGQNAGCGLSIGVLTGAHTKEQLQHAHPDYIIADLSPLPDLLQKNPETTT